MEFIGEIKCRVCGLAVKGRFYKLGDLDLCRDCGFLVNVILSSETKQARAQAVERLIERIGINEGKTKEDVMREIIEGKR